MAYLRDIECFAREWNLARIEFCRRFENARAEILKEGVFSYTSWYTPRNSKEQWHFTIRYVRDKGVAIYHGDCDKTNPDDMFYAPDLAAWCTERLWSYRKYYGKEGEPC